MLRQRAEVDSSYDSRTQHPGGWVSKHPWNKRIYRATRRGREADMPMAGSEFTVVCELLGLWLAYFVVAAGPARQRTCHGMPC